MFTNDITLAGDASSSTTYSLVSILGGKAIRTVSGQPFDQPKALTISHEAVGKGDGVTDRHMVRIDLTTSDEESGKIATASVYAVLVAPRHTITAAQIQDAVTQLKNFLTSGNVTKILNSEP